MELEKCFYQKKLGYCWLSDRRWMFQALDSNQKLVGQPAGVKREELVFHYDQDKAFVHTST